MSCLNGELMLLGKAAYIHIYEANFHAIIRVRSLSDNLWIFVICWKENQAEQEENQSKSFWKAATWGCLVVTCGNVHSVVWISTLCSAIILHWDHPQFAFWVILGHTHSDIHTQQHWLHRIFLRIKRKRREQFKLIWVSLEWMAGSKWSGICYMLHIEPFPPQQHILSLVQQNIMHAVHLLFYCDLDYMDEDFKKKTL